MGFLHYLLIVSFHPMLVFGADVEPEGRTWPQKFYERDRAKVLDLEFTPLRDVQMSRPDPDIHLGDSLEDPLLNVNFLDYNVILVVNQKESPEEPGQAMRVYLRGEGLIYYWNVSTGRKGYETPKGYFRVSGFSSKHYSKQYSSWMPWAVFYDGGRALHETPYIKNLGRSASHGCIRLEGSRAKQLFHLVGHSGRGQVPVIDPMGAMLLGENGLPQVVEDLKTLIIIK